MYRGVIGYGVYLPMNILYTSASQGIARESTPYKRHLKGSEPRFLMRSGQGWYVSLGSDLYLQNRGLNPCFRTLCTILEGDIIVQILCRNNQKKADMRLESVFDNLLKMLSNYDIMYAKSIQKIRGAKNTQIVYTNAGYTLATTCDILISQPMWR